MGFFSGSGWIVPRTAKGQAFCILYAIPGIVLNGYMLSVIGGTCQVVWTKSRKVFSKGVASIKSGWIRNILAVLTTAAVMWLILIVVPTLVFMKTENWNFFTGQYFTFVALSTIGFGDITPTHAALPPEDRTVLDATIYRVGLMLYFFVGMAVISIVFTGVWRDQKRRMMRAVENTKRMIKKHSLPGQEQPAEIQEEAEDTALESTQSNSETL